MKIINLILLISGCAIGVECQAQRAQPNINLDAIYFKDQPGLETPGRTNVEVQKSVERQTTEPDSYAQAAYGVQNQNFVPYNVVPLQRHPIPAKGLPSLNLQPPMNNNNSPNYYGGFSESNTLTKNEDASAGQALPTVVKDFHVSNVTLALTHFGLNVLRNVNRRGNLVVSPFSIAELLSLLQQGALGLTQQQISDALQMGPKTSLDAFQKINQDVKKRSSHNILKVANNIYVADAFELNKGFKTIAQRAYGSDVTPMAFSRSQEAVGKINSWVAKNTNNKITELLTEDAVGENTQMVLVNAVYFKGLWAVRFKPNSTMTRDFYVTDEIKKKQSFMRIRKIFRTGTDPSNNAQIVVIPFENEQYSLMVVLPSPVSSTDALAATLTAPQIAAYNTFSPKEVDLEIPKFTARADTDLNPVLMKMGITNVFGPQSELSNVGTFRTYSPQLSSAVHTAMLSIDEDGGTASAATSFAVVALSYDDPSISFKANRPFLAVLWDNESALPLFMAKIHDPSP